MKKSSEQKAMQQVRRVKPASLTAAGAGRRGQPPHAQPPHTQPSREPLRRDPDLLATGSNAPALGVRSLEVAIGHKVRLLRQRLEITAADLAAEAGLSAGMLSKIENGGTSPSLATLQALAHALNVPMTTFFADFDEKRDCSYVRTGQGVIIERRGTKAGHRYELLGHSLSGDIVVEPYLIRLLDDAEPYPLFQHEGIEFIYMLTGRMTYRHADKSYPLAPGDALFFDSGAPHGPEELVEKPMTFLSIIIYPRS